MLIQNLFLSFRSINMVYIILRQAVKIVLSIYFRKIYFIGKEKIPMDKPLLIACNHPTGFIEPCVVACFLPIPLHFMTRGDFFEKPLFNWFLRATHQLPIYRKKDGFKSLRKNPNNFTEAINTLKEGGRIIIYIEGSTSRDRLLRPFKKGLGRIASQVKISYPECDLKVLPICVNFSDANRFRSSVSVEIFDPISLDDYDFSEQKRFETVNNLTDHIYDSMSKGVFHLKDISYQDKFNRVLNKHLYDGYPSFRPLVESSNYLKNIGFKLVDTIDQIEESSQDEKLEWEDSFTFWDQLKVGILFPFALIGWVLNIIPTRVSYTITKNKVTSEEFYGPVLIASSLAIYILYFLLIIILGILLNYKILIALFLIPATGIIYLYWKELLEKIAMAKTFRNYPLELKEKIETIKNILHAE
jgi:1-acyl-sn-glycerol-3-phosphate acyltransferase